MERLSLKDLHVDVTKLDILDLGGCEDVVGDMVIGRRECMKNEYGELPVLEFKIIHGTDGVHVRHLVDLLLEGAIINEIALEECTELIEGGDPFFLRVLEFEVVPELLCGSTLDGLGSVDWILELAEFKSDYFNHSLFDETKCGLLSVGCAVGCSSRRVEGQISACDGPPEVPQLGRGLYLHGPFIIVSGTLENRDLGKCGESVGHSSKFIE